jgi:hypothetical protein
MLDPVARSRQVVPGSGSRMGGERPAASLGITKATNVARTKSDYRLKIQMKSEKTWHYIFAIPTHPIQRYQSLKRRTRVRSVEDQFDFVLGLSALQYVDRPFLGFLLSSVGVRRSHQGLTALQIAPAEPSRIQRICFDVDRKRVLPSWHYATTAARPPGRFWPALFKLAPYRSGNLPIADSIAARRRFQSARFFL